LEFFSLPGSHPSDKNLTRINESNAFTKQFRNLYF
jgi:hypothetical protein